MEASKRAGTWGQENASIKGEAFMKEIRFYRANEKPYGAFSNLYKRDITFEDEVFPTAEHAYQAGKAAKPAVRKWLMAAPSPSLLAMAAHGLYVWDIRSDWAKIKFDRMKNILRAKYSQHDDLRELLLSTGKAKLIETATADNAVNRLWGEVNGKGQNKLGQLLMEVREELRLEKKAKRNKRAGALASRKATLGRSKRRAAEHGLVA
jgi:ribA/ribD-fused uncharacterized protein